MGKPRVLARVPARVKLPFTGMKKTVRTVLGGWTGRKQAAALL